MCQIAYGVPSNETNKYLQSTTGNISGIFDMSGGALEYVMGNYNEFIGNSGFGILPNIKYYDLYSSTIFTGNASTNMNLCTLETCGGHALYETVGWYSDVSNFVDNHNQWFLRGGAYHYNSNAGIFSIIVRNGSMIEFTDASGFRLVIVEN